ncbi:MAG: hypothetical protein ACUVT1_13050 [Anaerolineae bacterium]
MFSDRIGKIQKARLYALEPERFTVDGEVVIVRGDHGSYILSKQAGEWACTCGYYRRHHWCAHTLAYEWLAGLRPSAM